MSLFKGSGVALITPFIKDKVDFDKLGELLEFHVNNKTDAIIICGTTGEASTMSEAERKETIEFTVKKINKRIPVIAGTGSNNTASSISMSKWAESIGVDGLLVITPYYNRTTQKGLIQHFTAINDAVNIPIILYNVPSRTGMNILPQTLLELSKLKNIVAVKEASGDISQIAKIKALCQDNLDIYSGNDDQILPILSLGGVGVISVLANIIPEETHNICEAFFKGNVKESLDLQLKYLELANTLFIENNPIPIKTALNLAGFKVGDLRLPLCEMEEKNLTVLENTLKKYNLL
ncbi:4-hydroxy-tetrahydrodipicolinate synthase [Inconstantimicrobium mannanitabidum]|uniref:4-hydroxy-tetrahydrodipicolinate synthase n=1 Tax=Inconstantimicrobium mannanitabidum TaxID=1604901 RepID=A0ACB5RAM4_9CLOT|nr:4-hydroxy-tetrahydrodipicolinate synthase [Clostridium sp. TW13]GKX66080.1 4-hydroxy-tetrahydrodipicolinate synthase [Clostridium sp. TW13]